MKTSTQVKILVADLLLLYGMLWLFCTTSPLVPENENQITLSIGTSGVYTAEFTGEPLTAIIETVDSVDFYSLDWSLANGNRIDPYLAPGTKIKRVTVQLYWRGLPTAYDSSTKPYTPKAIIYVKSGIAKSNSVTILVKNRAPSVDSITIEDTTYRIGSDVFRNGIYLYSQRRPRAIHFRIFASDLDVNDRTKLFATWNSSEQSRLFWKPESTLKAWYEVPGTDFRDTLITTLCDGNSGEVTVAFDLYQHIVADSPPVIDSIVARDTVFRGNSAIFGFRKYTLDSIPFKVYYHDPDGRYDTLKTNWRIATNTSMLTVRPTDSSRATFRCSGSFCSTSAINDTLIDTVIVSVSDQFDSSDVTKILIIKKGTASTNHAPIIDSVMFAENDGSDTTLSATASPVIFATDTLDSVLIHPYVHDLDLGDYQTFTYHVARNSSMLHYPWSDSSYSLYVCQGQFCSNQISTDTIMDSIRIIAKDFLNASDTVTIIIKRSPTLLAKSLHIPSVLPPKTEPMFLPAMLINARKDKKQ